MGFELCLSNSKACTTQRSLPSVVGIGSEIFVDLRLKKMELCGAFVLQIKTWILCLLCYCFQNKCSQALSQPPNGDSP